MKKFLTDIQQALITHADEKTQESAHRFFKEGQAVLVHGVGMAVVNQLVKTFLKELANQPKSKILSLCDTLWKSGYLEETILACGFAYNLRNQFEPKDMKRFHSWLKTDVNNWASCDTLCNHTIAALLEMHPELIHELKRWAKSKNRWERRGAAVTLIIPARKGLFLNDIFEISDVLMLDADDLVQKGYGWMLKAASEAHQKEVFDFVMSHKATMPRTALRYAIEKMPKELKAQAMKK